MMRTHKQSNFYSEPGISPPPKMDVEVKPPLSNRFIHGDNIPLDDRGDDGLVNIFFFSSHIGIFVVCPTGPNTPLRL